MDDVELNLFLCKGGDLLLDRRDELPFGLEDREEYSGERDRDTLRGRVLDDVLSRLEYEFESLRS